MENRKKIRVNRKRIYDIKEAKEQDKQYRKQLPVDGDFRKGAILFTKDCGTCHTLEKDTLQ